MFNLAKFITKTKTECTKKYPQPLTLVLSICPCLVILTTTFHLKLSNISDNSGKLLISIRITLVSGSILNESTATNVCKHCLTRLHYFWFFLKNELQAHTLLILFETLPLQSLDFHCFLGFQKPEKVVTQ